MTMKKMSFIKEKIVNPFKEAISKGITPHDLAFTISLGITLGVFPIVGTTSGLCLLAAWIFNLNIPILQAINLIMTPFDIALAIPFMRLGENIFNLSRLEIQPKEIFSKLISDPSLVIFSLITAIVAWVILALPTAFVLYTVLKSNLSRRMKKKI